MNIKSDSEENTRLVAKELARNLRGNVIALTGKLGAGKTTFSQGFAEGLGIKDKIISPTFVLVRQHKIPNSNGVLYHVDLYRLENPKDLEELGLEEFWSSKENIVLIEWAEKLKKLPQGSTKITIQKNGLNERTIIIHSS